MCYLVPTTFNGGGVIMAHCEESMTGCTSALSPGPGSPAEWCQVLNWVFGPPVPQVSPLLSLSPGSFWDGDQHAAGCPEASLRESETDIGGYQRIPQHSGKGTALAPLPVTSHWSLWCPHLLEHLLQCFWFLFPE